MRRLELLIDEARDLSQNTRYDSNSGISQKMFTRYFKNAYDQLYKEIQNTKSKFFIKESTEDVVPGQALYPYPYDIYLFGIDTLEWSSNLSGDNYITLEKSINKERLSANASFPFGYIPKFDGFVLTPVLNKGRLRINYSKKLPQLEKRSGKISAITVTTSISAITLNTLEASFDASYLNSVQSFCIVSAAGSIKVRGVQITSVDSGTGVVTMSSHALQTGDLTPAVGDYVCAGDFTENLSPLPDICESYLIKHAVYEAKYGDSSQWTDAAIKDMSMCLGPIIEGFARPSEDIVKVPITNTDYLSIG